MKKTLSLLLALSFPSIDYAHESNKTHTHGADIENVAPYKHPRAKKVGDFMPQPIGKPIKVIDLYVNNSEGIEGAVRDAGKIYGFDRNPEDEKNIAEYEYIARICDEDKKVMVYAVYDVPHKLLYVDSNRDRYIDSVVDGIDFILDATLPMIPTRCEDDLKNKMNRKDI